VVDEDGELAEGEVVDGLPVVAEDDDGVLEARPAFGGAVSVPTVQAAALAATGFRGGCRDGRGGLTPALPQGRQEAQEGRPDRRDSCPRTHS